MPHDIIDNRTRELAPEINNFLADSIRAHFAVGYFFLSGFQAVAEHIPHLDQLRLLIGNVTNRQTIEQLAEGYHHLATLQRAVRREWMAGTQAPRIRAETADSIQSTLELMDQTDDAQALVLSLADFIAQGKVQVRVYTRGRLHAKAYLFDFDPARIRAQTGAAIVGSSNLSLGGVTHNTELNVRVFGDGNHAELSRWFNGLWNEAEDFDADLIHELRRSWAASQVPTPEGPRPVSPHDITVPLTARAHRELNNLRRSTITGQALVEQLLRIVRDYNLEEAHRALADQVEEAPLIPRILCSEALL